MLWSKSFIESVSEILLAPECKATPSLLTDIDIVITIGFLHKTLNIGNTCNLESQLFESLNDAVKRFYRFSFRSFYC